MKFNKILLPFLAGALALSLAACGKEDKAAKGDTPQEETKQEETKQEETKHEASAQELEAKLADQQVKKDKIVAIVNDEELIGEDYNSVLKLVQVEMQQAGQDPSSKESAEQGKEQALNTLVNQTLILQEANKAEIKASSSEIDEKYAMFEKQYGDEEEMNKVLKDQGMDEKMAKEDIAASIIFVKYQDKVAPAGKVTDEEIKDYYDQVASQSKEAGQELPPLDEVSEEIKGIIQQGQQQKLLVAHVEELKKDAKIELKI